MDDRCLEHCYNRSVCSSAPSDPFGKDGRILRSLIVSDVHGNLEALRSVIGDAEQRGGFDQIWSLGDIVGYGPNPAECIDLIRRYDTKGIAGNHDLAMIGKVKTDSFSKDSTASIRWATLQITFEQFSYLLDLPQRMEAEGFTMVHGSPREPFWREYLITPESAAASFQHIATDYCLVGHSHRSFVCRPQGESAVFEEVTLDTPLALEGHKAIVNPGSVGQPRDRDPRASYAVFDSAEQTLTHHRVQYDVSATQAGMLEAGLPRYLIERLAVGL